MKHGTQQLSNLLRPIDGLGCSMLDMASFPFQWPIILHCSGWSSAEISRVSYGEAQFHVAQILEKIVDSENCGGIEHLCKRIIENPKTVYEEIEKCCFSKSFGLLSATDCTST